jgi:hypothetical protein
MRSKQYPSIHASISGTPFQVTVSTKPRQEYTNSKIIYPKQFMRTIHEPKSKMVEEIAEHFKTLISAIIFVNENNQNIPNDILNHLQGKGTKCDFMLNPRHEPYSGTGSIVLSEIDNIDQVLKKLEYKFSFDIIQEEGKSGLLLTIDSIHNYEFDKDNKKVQELVSRKDLDISMKLFNSENPQFNNSGSPQFNIADRLIHNLTQFPSHDLTQFPSKVVYLDDWRKKIN